MKSESKKARITETTPPSIAVMDREKTLPADTEMLLRKAHRVLLHRMPGVTLPDELSRVRALLDAHMFGHDERTARDDVVEVARQIDRTLPT
jgi:hypothetical protein